MLIKKKLLLIFGIAALSSCKKDEQELSYPATFEADKVYNISEIKMYTKDGEVKEQRVIASYMGRHVELYVDFRNSWHTEILEGDKEKVMLESPTNARVQSKENIKEYSLSASGTELTLTENIERSILVDERNTDLKFMADFHEAISKYKILKYDEKALSPATGYTRSYKTRERRYATFRNGRLEFPILVYAIVRREKDNIVFIKNHYNNEFDPACLKMLGESDTLVYQQFILSAVKQ